MVPISLFTSITETKSVSSVRAWTTASGSTTPLFPTGTRVTVNPSLCRLSQASRTAGCSMAVVTICRFRLLRASPLMAKLLASVAPEVNTSSSGFAPKSLASVVRA
ncbi:hypothetical protein HRbin09_02093 [bacterium HR09]|nr:hypothetical protein HRbin09_02093 [bacterium HR09]